MYNERAKFEFLDSVPQSERLRFLAELAAQFEQVPWPLPTPAENPGYSIDVAANGRIRIDVWHPGKAQVLWPRLRAAQASGILRVTSPAEFA